MSHLTLVNQFVTRLAGRLTTGALVTALAFTAQQAGAQETTGIAIGTKAPGAAVETLDGAPMNLQKFMGKQPVVMEFWATWCPLCRKLEPQMKALRAEYGKRVTFVSVGVPQNQTPERQLEHVTKEAMTGEFVFDRNSAAIGAYKVPHTSYVVVIDAGGTVVYTGVGAEQDLRSAVQRAFDAPMSGKSR